MDKEIEITPTTWWIIGGASVAVLGIGGYLWFNKYQKNKAQEKRMVSRTPNFSKESSSEASSTRQVPNWENPFDMGYLDDVAKWVAPKSIEIIDATKAEELAKKLKQSKGVFNDEEEEVALIFKKELKDKAQVASLSKAFWKLYKKDLWEYLNSFLSKKELHSYVTMPVKRLPNYTIK